MSEENIDKYYKSQEFKDMFRNFEKARSEGRDCMLASDDIIDIAEFYYMYGDLEHARQTAEYALSIYRDAEAPLLFMAKFELQHGNGAEKAEEYLSKVDDRQNVDFLLCSIEVSMLKGEDLRQTQRLVDDAFNCCRDDDKEDFAIEALHLLLDYHSANLASHLYSLAAGLLHSDEGTLVKARMQLENGNYDKGLKMMESLIDKDAFNAEYWNILATAQLYCEKYSDAITSEEYAIAIDPSCYDAYMNMGNAYIKLCNYSKAMEAFAKCSDLRDDEVALMMRGRCLFYMHNDEAALVVLELAKSKCTADLNNKVNILKDLAIISSGMGQFDKAKEYLKEAKQISPKRFDLEFTTIQLGIMVRQGHIAEASLFLNEEAHKVPQAECVNMLFQSALVFYENQYDSIAYKFFKAVYNLERNRHRGIPHFAMCCYSLRKWDEYLEALEIAVSEVPDETKAILAEIFPQGMEPYDYLKYAQEHQVNKN